MSGGERLKGRLVYLMGPSGSGKDSLIDAARDALAQLNCVVARRVITRSAESAGESAFGVSVEAFADLVRAGAFAMSWRANGLGYGIPVEIDQWLAEGRHVLVNGSREYLPQAQERYPTLIPVLLSVRSDVLRQRLMSRGREGIEEIEARLARNALFAPNESAGWAEAGLLLDNSDGLSLTVSHLMDLLRREGVSIL
ncbi:phosphonate metabolism protein/1,5-bisphosphokinase (PRPP-forming) PhnN [Pseudomonas fluorescens]|uniref:phosphonate metabolism protein/1,5-bisphosphokinase (PRPP-forming) PhnN n=1 Tax=Pseudomonas fluorescens TaxID=294 RepID=UPI0004822EBC